MGLEDGDRLFVLPEVPEAYRAVAPANCNEMRLIWTSIETLQGVSITRPVRV